MPHAPLVRLELPAGEFVSLAFRRSWPRRAAEGRAGLNRRGLRGALQEALALRRAIRAQIGVTRFMTDRRDHMGPARGFSRGLCGSAFETAIETELGSRLGKFVAAAAIGHRREFVGLSRSFEDPIDFLGCDPVKICDLPRRHAVSCQCTHPADLRRRHGDLAGLRDASPSRRVCDWWLRLWERGKPWRDCEDARLSPRRLIGWRALIRCRLRHLYIGGVGRRGLEELLGCLSGSGDPFSIISFICQLPIFHRA